MDKAGNCGPPSFQDEGSFGALPATSLLAATEPRNRIVTSSNLERAGVRAEVKADAACCRRDQLLP